VKIFLYICIWIAGGNCPVKMETRTPLPDTFVRDNVKTGIMKEISLNKGFTTQVDDEDYKYLNQFKWRVAIYNHTSYARRTLWIKGENRSISLHMHRVILNVPIGMQVDHIDHNGLNNQKSNIRICTETQNHRNKKPNGKYRGISWVPKLKKWRAYIFINNRQIWVGAFIDDISAAKARDEAAKEIYGEFATLNFKD
jgi:hypothetical protein